PVATAAVIPREACRPAPGGRAPMAPACRAPYCPPQSPSTGVLACRAVAAACNPTTAIMITVIPMPIAPGAWRRLAVLACLLAAMPAAGAQAKVQPDILLIVVDDLGYSD